jgi:hypothetical protein
VLPSLRAGQRQRSAGDQLPDPFCTAPRHLSPPFRRSHRTRCLKRSSTVSDAAPFTFHRGVGACPFLSLCSCAAVLCCDGWTVGGLSWSTVFWGPLFVALILLLRLALQLMSRCRALYRSWPATTTTTTGAATASGSLEGRDDTLPSTLLVSLSSARVLLLCCVAVAPAALYWTWKHMLLMVADDMALSNQTDPWIWCVAWRVRSLSFVDQNFFFCHLF